VPKLLQSTLEVKAPAQLMTAKTNSGGLRKDYCISISVTS